MHAHAHTHAHKLQCLCMCPADVCAYLMLMFLFVFLKKKKKKKGTLILLMFFVTPVSVSVQNKRIAQSQVCTTTKVREKERERERVEFNASHTQCIQTQFSDSLLIWIKLWETQIHCSYVAKMLTEQNHLHCTSSLVKWWLRIIVDFEPHIIWVYQFYIHKNKCRHTWNWLTNCDLAPNK